MLTASTQCNFEDFLVQYLSEDVYLNYRFNFGSSFNNINFFDKLKVSILNLSDINCVYIKDVQIALLSSLDLYLCALNKIEINNYGHIEQDLSQILNYIIQKIYSIQYSKVFIQKEIFSLSLLAYLVVIRSLEIFDRFARIFKISCKYVSIIENAQRMNIVSILQVLTQCSLSSNYYVRSIEQYFNKVIEKISSKQTCVSEEDILLHIRGFISNFTLSLFFNCKEIHKLPKKKKCPFSNDYSIQDTFYKNSECFENACQNNMTESDFNCMSSRSSVMEPKNYCHKRQESFNPRKDFSKAPLDFCDDLFNESFNIEDPCQHQYSCGEVENYYGKGTEKFMNKFNQNPFTDCYQSECDRPKFNNFLEQPSSEKSNYKNNWNDPDSFCFDNISDKEQSDNKCFFDQKVYHTKCPEKVITNTTMPPLYNLEPCCSIDLIKVADPDKSFCFEITDKDDPISLKDSICRFFYQTDCLQKLIMKDFFSMEKYMHWASIIKMLKENYTNVEINFENFSIC